MRLVAFLLLACAAGSAFAYESGTVYSQTSNALGSMVYRVHAPAGLTAAVPLFVHIHGANIDVEDVAHQSRLDTLADERGFVVVFPQEDPSHGNGIWDGDVAAAEGRDGRATSLIAQITREVMAAYPIDPRRVFVGGISAGSTMAIVMGAQYPDLYSGVQAEGGDRYGPITVYEEQAGRDVYDAMGPRARRIPFMLSVGTLDPFGYTTRTNSVMHHWLIAHDWMDDGLRNGSVPLTPASTRTGFEGKPYSVDTYVDANGCVLAERWLITGMTHAYAGGDPARVYDVTSDPNAPNMRAVAYDFFLDQYDADGPPGCKTSTPRVAVADPPAGGSLDAGILSLLLLAIYLNAMKWKIAVRSFAVA